jgi:PhzF family phenazine biosynthesis protein
VNTLPFKQVDVFTQKPFLGNPVAVVLDAQKLAGEQMQRIAAWTNLSETTFVLPPSSGDADYRLRIFTPKQELPFAGHPTIGSAHAVMESGFAKPRDGRLRQQCLAGEIELKIDRTADGERIFVRAPQPRVSALEAAQTRRLSTALGMSSDTAVDFLRVDVGVVWLVGDLGEAARVAGLQPNLDEIRKLSEETHSAGVTLFGRARDGRSQLQSRSFAPLLGVPEDPVCGSGNASVAAFLVHTGLIREIGADYLTRQGMEVGRDGEIAVSIENQGINFGGYAVTCVDGRLRVE